MSKLPNFTKTEYAVCNIKNLILVTGGRTAMRRAFLINPTVISRSNVPN